MTSKINSHLKEINFVKSILPITKIILETASFDLHALSNPQVLTNKKLYQKGINYGFLNTRAYVLDRDSHTCRNCKAKKVEIQVHHIVFRSNNGSDKEDNLISLCEECHKKLHKGKIKLKGGKVKSQLKHATQMNSIRIQLLKKLSEAEETFGFITKEHRQLLNLPKEHYIDAVVIASQGQQVNLENNRVLYKKCISDGDYQRTKGVRSEKKIPTGKVQGFRKFDKVKYLKKEYFVKGKMSTGYAQLMGVDNKLIKFKHIPKFSEMTRISARKTWIIC